MNAKQKVVIASNGEFTVGATSEIVDIGEFTTVTLQDENGLYVWDSGYVVEILEEYEG